MKKVQIQMANFKVFLELPCIKQPISDLSRAAAAAFALRKLSQDIQPDLKHFPRVESVRLNFINASILEFSDKGNTAAELELTKQSLLMAFRRMFGLSSTAWSDSHQLNLK